MGHFSFSFPNVYRVKYADVTLIESRDYRSTISLDDCICISAFSRESREVQALIVYFRSIRDTHGLGRGFDIK